MKAKVKRDEGREERITMEIVVDAYNQEERAMGWYYYLESQLEFPFTASCVAKRAISPLQIKDDVDVIGLADERECSHEIFVTIRWGKEGLAVVCVCNLQIFDANGCADQMPLGQEC